MKEERTTNLFNHRYYVAQTNENIRKVQFSDTSPSAREALINYIKDNNVSLSSIEPSDLYLVNTEVYIYSIDFDKSNNKQIHERIICDDKLTKLMDRQNISYVINNYKNLTNSDTVDHLCSILDSNKNINTTYNDLKAFYNNKKKEEPYVCSISSVDSRDVFKVLIDLEKIDFKNYTMVLTPNIKDDIINSVDIGLLALDYQKRIYDNNIASRSYIDNNEILEEASSKKPMKNLMVIELDNTGNIIISKKEYDMFDEHFKESNRLLKVYKRTKNTTGAKTELAKIYYMCKFIETYHMGLSKDKEQIALQKEMIDLRSVMLNTFNSNMEWVIKEEPSFNFTEYFDKSKYGASLKINTIGAINLTKKLLTLL